MEIRAFKFSPTDSNKKDILQNKTPLEFLKSKYQRDCVFGLDNLQKSGMYKLMGWAYDFRPFMKKFVVKQYDTWQEYYAPNKTMLRNSIFGAIQKIVEIK